VLEFWHAHNQVIYKSISGIRSIVSRLTDTHRERLHWVNSCPTQFQEFVEGVDYRVHVVGKNVFPCRIVSKADDYRYAPRQGEPVDIESCTLPIDLCKRCIELTEDLGLVISGIDLRKTPTGRWYCFEVNPSPGFTYYEEATGQPIAEAIAKLLAATVTKI
jgi:glutathione synthase/RimK-type ligase-like ATP-grasp enzyme